MMMTRVGGTLILLLYTLVCCNGEWVQHGNSSSSGVPMYSHLCNIERRAQLSLEEFTGHYQRNNVPVIIARDPSTNAIFQQMCQREYLLQYYPNVTVTLSSANTFSYKKKKIKLGQYIHEMVGVQDESLTGIKTYILFGDTEITELQSLLHTYNPLFFGNFESSLSWGIAGSGTGVPFHRHGAVFNEVIYGYKRWFLYPPTIEPHFDAKQTTLNWVKTIYSSPTFDSHMMQECVLGPNEILFVPDNWWHATLNIGQTVNIATFV